MGLVLVLASCSSSKKLPSGAPPEMKLKEFLSAVEENENQYENLRIKFNATYKSEGSSQSFRLEARLFADSAVWLDIADPILGFKVIRAIVYKDSVALVNRLDKEYMTGKAGKLREEFDVDFGFSDLQNILSANVLFPLTREFELFYRPGLYLLSDFDPESDNPALYAGKEIFRQMSFNPEKLKPVLQVQNEPAMGRRYTVAFKDFQPKDGMMYPGHILINFLEKSEGSLELDVRDVQKNDPNLNLPFNIPSSYAPMR